MHEAEKEFVLRIDSRVDEIGERVSRIEANLDDESPKTLKKKLSESAGLVALFLSIAVASFTLIDKFVTQPQKEKIQQKIDFRNDVNDLASTIALISGLDFVNNKQGALAAMRTYTPKRLALIEKIQKSDSAMPSVLKYADRILLARELNIFERLEEALLQVDLALDSATDARQTANAYWVKAGFLGHSNQLTEMRENYSLAQMEFESWGLRSTASSVMEIHIEWIGFELRNGTCATARDAFSKMVGDVEKPDIWPLEIQQIEDDFNKMLSRQPKTCNLVLNKEPNDEQ